MADDLRVHIRDFFKELIQEGHADGQPELGAQALRERPEYKQHRAAGQDAADQWLASAMVSCNIRTFAGSVKSSIESLALFNLAGGNETRIWMANNPTVKHAFPHNPEQTVSSRRCAVMKPFLNAHDAHNVAHLELFGIGGAYNIKCIVVEDVIVNGCHQVRLHLCLGHKRSLMAVRYTYLTIEPSGIATWTPFEVRLNEEEIFYRAALMPWPKQDVTRTASKPLRNITSFQGASEQIVAYEHLGIGRDIHRLGTHLESLALLFDRPRHL